MESLNNYVFKAGENLKRYLMTAGLVSVLTCFSASCGRATPEDVIRQKEEVEMIGYQLRSYINSRKDAVRKYNDLIKYPRTESNAGSIEKVRRDLLDKIKSYDKKIESLAKDKIDAEMKMSEGMAECIEYVDYNNTDPLDPDKYDFLLDF